MLRTGSRLTIFALTIGAALGAIFGAAQANADHDDELRVHIPIVRHGADTVDLYRLLQRHRHVDVHRYRLQSVVLRNGPFSDGYATLTVGGQRGSRVALRRHEHARIPAYGHGHDWLLRLGPGSQVRMVTLILEPRWPAMASYRSIHYRPKAHGHKRYAHAHARANARERDRHHKRHGRGAESDRRHGDRDHKSRHGNREDTARREEARQGDGDRPDGRSRDGREDRATRVVRSDGDATPSRTLYPRLRASHG